MSGRPEPLGREAYRVFRAISTRWSDNDMFGHVNNVAYYSWFDTAVTGWLLSLDQGDPTTSDVIYVVAETGCAYFASVSFPDEIEVGIAVERLGRSSVAYRIGVFRAGDARPAAQGRFVHVYVRRGSQSPVPIPEAVRARMEAIRAP